MPMNTRAAHQNKQRNTQNRSPMQTRTSSAPDSPKENDATVLTEACNEGSTAIPGPASIVDAIVEAFADKKLLNNLIPALSQALHDCFMAEITKRDETIQQLQRQVDETQAQLEDLEQYSRRNCLLVHGIPESSQEDTNAVIRELAKDKLEQDISPLDIDRSHRLGQRGKKDAKGRQLHRPIIIKFSRYSTRSQFYDARKRLKGSKMFIHENLTAKRQKWLHDTRRKYPAPNNKVWSQDGRIKIRTDDNKLLTISCDADLIKHNIRRS